MTNLSLRSRLLAGFGLVAVLLVQIRAATLMGVATQRWLGNTGATLGSILLALVLGVALGTFAAYECDVRHVAMDDEGLVPEAVVDEVQRLAREGRKMRASSSLSPAMVSTRKAAHHRTTWWTG